MNLRVPLTDDQIHRLLEAGVTLDEPRVALLENPDLFIGHFFRHKLTKLEDFHLRLIASATQHLKSLVLYPAFHGKTTLVATCLPIWSVCREPNDRIGIITKNESDASGVMRAIQAELEDNDELIRMFGPFKPEKGSSKPWALSKLEVRHRTRRGPRPTIQVYGSGGNVFGHRTDWTICDDVVTDKNSVTPELRAKVREWYNLGVRTMPEEQDDRLTVVGTRFHPEDLYGDLLEMRSLSDERVYYVQHEDAVTDEEFHQTLWPERWPWNALMDLKQELGTLDFNKRLRNIAVDPERMVFREEYVKGGWLGTEKYPGCLDRQHVCGDTTHVKAIYGGFDPAIGTGKGRSFCVWTALGVGACEQHEQCWWVIDMERDTMSLPRQADTILREYQKYHGLILGARVEANAYQGGLNHLIDERMGQRGIAFRIEPHQTGNNKLDPEIGVAGLGPWFEKGLVHIPYGDPHSRRKMQVFIRELTEYPGRSYDTVMSFWIAALAAKDMAPRFTSYNRLPREHTARKLVGSRLVLNPFYEELNGEPVEEDEAAVQPSA